MKCTCEPCLSVFSIMDLGDLAVLLVLLLRLGPPLVPRLLRFVLRSMQAGYAAMGKKATC